MTRIDGVSTRTAGPLVRLVYRLSRRQLGRDVAPVSVYAHTPRLLVGYGMFEQATARQHGVEERLKVLAETKAAAVVNCEFCCDIASSIAREAGVTEQQLLALAHYRESEEFTPLERLVLDYAVAMSRTPTTVTDELFAALRQHFDERQLVELTNVIALENMRARFNSAFDMTPAGFSEGMVCVAPEVVPEAIAAA
ncbi:MAG TPA: carboxymuconolactone decarboxylase family protein [Solirubrobacteraceae bacterium]|nr:carboxymuconolactone decarboxylase family protein [Solirubrobacteraceae bacterium]